MPAVRTPIALLALALFGFSSASRRESTVPASKLHIEEVGSDSTSFDVVATLIVGPTDVLLWDAEYHVADARRVADRIAATGKHLKAIVISHPDHDHYSGAAAIIERFPGTPVYMTAKALAHYDTTKYYFQREKSRRPAMLPDSLVTPQVLPSTHLTLDGEELTVIPDLTGDVMTPTNSVLGFRHCKRCSRATLSSTVSIRGSVAPAKHRAPRGVHLSRASPNCTLRLSSPGTRRM